MRTFQQAVLIESEIPKGFLGNRTLRITTPSPAAPALNRVHRQVSLAFQGEKQEHTVYLAGMHEMKLQFFTCSTASASIRAHLQLWTFSNYHVREMLSIFVQSGEDRFSPIMQVVNEAATYTDELESWRKQLL